MRIMMVLTAASRLVPPLPPCPIMGGGGGIALYGRGLVQQWMSLVMMKIAVKINLMPLKIKIIYYKIIVILQAAKYCLKSRNIKIRT